METEENNIEMGITKILVGTDFSDYSDRALAYAEMLAKKFSAKIILLHVIESFPYSVTDSMTVIGHDQALSATASALLENLQQRVVDQGLPTDNYLEHGTAYREIIKKAEDEAADLILIGTHGRTGMEHLLLGGVAEKVVRLATCPVLTVPGK